MAPIVFTLLSLLCMFQALAAAPLHRRAVTSPACSKANVAAILGIDAARTSLGSINTAPDIGNARTLLQAQLALLDANNGTTQIADSLLTNAPPAPADANARIVAGLQAAQALLGKVFSGENSTTLPVQAANSSITAALAAAQQAVASNCTTTVT